jgi:hypothetical protein
VWTEDEAGPYQTKPYPGQSWEPAAHPARLPHEYLRQGTAKLLTLFHPASGEVRVKGVTRTTNVVVHGWLQEELSAILATLPPPTDELSMEERRALWARWQEGLQVKPTLPADPPPLRMLLVLDNLRGHKTPAFVRWLFAQGIMPLYTPVSGSWLNMTESVQRIRKRRALEGHYPTTPAEIIAWLEAAARGWNADPTPFEWGGKRAARRARARARRHAVGGSGACTWRPLRRRPTQRKWRCA